MISLAVENVGKAYKRYDSRSGRIAEWLGMGPRHSLNWVLRDVSFTVASGESVGIVGANGAGKSTLLKIIAGTVLPTTGNVSVNGRVSALLELGIGFDPEFTGRQNVFMTGHLLGSSSAEIASRMPDIEAFAEIGDYIDRPVRTYSSGMQVRLAFSVATAVRPDILVVDEALSVGDTYFQHKSFDRIKRFRDAGTTLLFVSHSPGAVKMLCSRAILLDRGIVLQDGPPDAVMDYYNALIAAQQEQYEIRQGGGRQGESETRSGTGAARVASIELLVEGSPTTTVRVGDAATVRVAVVADRDLEDLTVGILIRDRLGMDVFGTNTFYLGENRAHVAAGERLAVDFSFPALDLGIGSYSLTVALHSADSHVAANYDWWDRAHVFQMIPGPGPRSVGVCTLAVSAAWSCGDNAHVGESASDLTAAVSKSGGGLDG